MTRAVVALVAAGCVIATGACFTVDAELPGVLRTDVTAAELERVGKLEVEVKNTFYVQGLFGSPPADFLAGELKKQIEAKGADGVANLVYESESSCGDVAFSACTLGCIAPRTYRVRGDIVRIKAERLPGRPAKLVENEHVVAHAF